MSKDDKYIKYGKLLPGLIHNLNTPLMGCSGRVELLQMKMGEDKHLSQMTVQLDRINEILVAVAYLLDKDQTDKDTGFDLKVFLGNYYAFLNTDMRFKHQMEKELTFEKYDINTNPSSLMNYLHAIMNHLLEYIEDISIVTIGNASENGNPCINIIMKYNAEIKEEYIEPLKNIKQIVEDKLDADTISNYELQVEVTNEVAIKIVIPQTL